jgi:hypothetical protein
MLLLKMDMGKSLDEYIDQQKEVRRLDEISADEARAEFEKLAIETGDPELLEYLKGKDIARHVIDMVSRDENITYPPIIEAFITEEDEYRPLDTPLNKGLFDVFEVEEENPSSVNGSFIIQALGVTVNLEPVPNTSDLSLNERIGLGPRKQRAPFLRASI